MDSAERYSCLAAGKARHTPKIQTSISYEHLDRDVIISSRQEAATHRSHHTRSTSLPKIATGRSVHSAKKLWQDYETIEVKAKVQRENEKTPEVPPLRVPKNPHSLYKHTVRNVKPYHILHSPSDYGRANHQLRQLYAQVTYLSNAVRNCDGTASYRGMCKSRQSYRGDGDDPLRLHWASSNDKKPVPRLLLPVMPGTNTKWYSWKVDTPREEGSPRDGGVVRGSDKRYASSAPVSRSVDFIQRYSKKHHVVFSVDDEGGRRSKNSKDMDSKSKDGHLSVKSIEGAESLASSSLSSIIRYDASKFKLSDTESVAGTVAFLTQTETGKVSPEVQRKQGDVSTGGQLRNEETEKTEDAAADQEEKRTSEGEHFSSAKEEGVVQTKATKTEATTEGSPEDELDIVAKANEVADTQQVSDKPQKASNAVTDTTVSHNPQQGDSVPQQQDVDIATNVQSEDPITEDQRKVVEVTSDKEDIFQSQDGDPITIDSGTDNPENASSDNQQTVQSNDDIIASTPANHENPAIPSNSDNEQYNSPNSGNGNSELEQHPSEDSNLQEDDQPHGVHLPHTEGSLDAHEVDEVQEDDQPHGVHIPHTEGSLDEHEIDEVQEDDQPHAVHIPHTEGSLDAHEVDEVHEEKQVYEANEHTQEGDTTYTSQDT